MQQEIYQTISIIKTIINLLLLTYQDKKNTSIPQEINFVGKIEEDNGEKLFLIAEKQQKTVLNFSLEFSNCNGII